MWNPKVCDHTPAEDVLPPRYDAPHWNADPSESFSDWTIQVIDLPSRKKEKVEEDTISKKYHVHKFMLAFGSKKCEYFHRLFHQKGFAESESATSRIELDELAAAAFPTFLDYLYSPQHQVSLTTENAVAQYSIGDYFECPALRWEVNQFWKKDLSVANCHTYYEHALVLSVDSIRKAVAGLCSKNVLAIKPDSPLLRVSDQQLWLDVLQSNSGSYSRHKSLLVAAFCETHKVDSTAFEELTSAEFLPDISFEAAQKLMVLQSEIANIDSKEVSSLQERCAEAIAYCWTDINTEQEGVAFFSNLPPTLTAKILLKGLADAQNQCAGRSYSNSSHISGAV